jgi:hypothetical protein
VRTRVRPIQDFALGSPSAILQAMAGTAEHCVCHAYRHGSDRQTRRFLAPALSLAPVD